ncbi:O-methyltransferase [Roseibium sp.]|uniref:O-methyltransferase n=1 Tax=Roseibium sp. TaxID=1936156 RepID=UPI003B520A98
MSASTLPYHLRPQKSVDRRLFLDLLNRFERHRSLKNYAYISMGAYPLEDHKLVHRLLGVTRLIAFDFSQDIVNRQKFNRPINSCHCFCMKSGELIDNIDDVLSDANAADCSGIIVWLDYTAPSQIGEQIREFQTLIDRLSENDLVRITVNAHPPALGEFKDENGKRLDKLATRKKRFERLKSRIGDYLQTEITSDHMTDDYLPLALSGAFGKAASKALPPTSGRSFMPLSIVRYADGHQMLSITGMISKRTEKEAVWNALEMSAWPFASKAWNEIHRLFVPDLTLRERMVLDRSVATGSYAGVAEELGFSFDQDVDLNSFLDNYKDFYRFYPSLLTAEV